MSEREKTRAEKLVEELADEWEERMTNRFTNSSALIAEAQEHYSEMNGLNSRAAEVMMELVAALESATRVSAIDPAMIERFKTGWNAANNMDLFGGRVHAGLVAALDVAPDMEYTITMKITDQYETVHFIGKYNEDNYLEE